MRARTVQHTFFILASAASVLAGLIAVPPAEAATPTPTSKVSASPTASPKATAKATTAPKASVAPTATVAPTVKAALVAVPTAPFVESVQAEGLSLLVAWAPNDPTQNVTNYSVTATPSAGSTTTACPAPASKSMSAPGTDSSAVIGSLCQGVVYTVKVSATNAGGTGPLSVASNPVVPLAGTVPGQPMVSDVLSRSGQLSVAWTAPVLDGGSAILSYTITAQAGTGTPISTSASASVSTATISGLTNGTVYNLAVTATNSFGTSVAGKSTGTPKAAYVPQAATGFNSAPTGANTINVSWKAPVDDGGSAITGYSVVYQQATRNSDGTWTLKSGAQVHTISASATATSVTATAFETMQAFYWFSIIASNAVGASTPAVAQAPVSPVVGTTSKQVVLSSATVTALVSVTPTSLVWTSPAPSQATAVTVGQVLVAAPGGLLPEGALRTVTAISTSGGQLTLTTVQAALSDVFTNMSLDTGFDPTAQVAGSFATPQTQTARPKAKFRATAPGVQVLPQDIGGSVSFGKSVSFGVNRKIGPVDVALTASLSASFKAAINVRTSWIVIPDGMSVDASASVTAKVEGSVKIGGADSWQIGEIDLPPIDIQVGPVPVILRPKVPIYLGIGGEIGVSVSVSATVGAAIHWDSSNAGNLDTKNLTTAPGLNGAPLGSATATGSLTATVTVMPEILLYGAAGPDVQANLALKADVNFIPAPGENFLTITPSVTLKAGLDLQLFKYTRKIEVTVGIFTFPGFAITRPPSSHYTITSPSPYATIGTPLTLTATRSDGTVTTKTWTLAGGTGSDNVTSAGVFTADNPANRSVKIIVSDSSGAGGELTLPIGQSFDAPGSLQATQTQDATGQNLNLSWTAPTHTGLQPVSSYVVVTSPSTGIHTLPATQTSLQILHLASGSYGVSVYAVNGAGAQSAPATTSIYITPACSITWTGTAGDGSWSTAANWSPARVPGNADWVCLSGAATILGPVVAAVASIDHPENLTVNGSLEIGAAFTGASLNGTGVVTLGPAVISTFTSVSPQIYGVTLVNKGILSLPVGLTTYNGGVLDNHGLDPVWWTRGYAAFCSAA